MPPFIFVKEVMLNTRASILIVDESIEQVAHLQSLLLEKGFRVDLLDSSHNVADYVLAKKPDVLVLDLALPDQAALAICKAVRQNYNGYIVIISNTNDSMDELLGLELGADQFLTRPLQVNVLLAHINALLRRKQREKIDAVDDSKLRRGSLVLDAVRRKVMMGEHLLDLTDQEFDLLHYLMQHQGEVLSRELIYDNVYQQEYRATDRSLDLNVSRLRKKIGDCSRRSQLIKTIRNQGYMLATEAFQVTTDSPSV